MKKYLPIKPTITPKVHPYIDQCLNEHASFIVQKTTQTLGPLHIVFPNIVEERIDTLRDVFKKIGMDVDVYVAHKPTRSTALMCAAYNKGVSVDVASLGELEHVLQIGWKGHQIECTGAKHPLFIQKGIEVGALISIDSVQELELVIALAKQTPVRILLRISNPSCSDRNKVTRTSRFGITKERIETDIYPILKKHQHVTLEGFHIHNDERDGEVKGEYIFDMLDMIQKSYAYGFSPKLINIGGGWRDKELTDPQQWQAFIESIESNLVKGNTLSTWRQGTFGLYVNEKGRISGREKVQGKFLEILLDISVSQIFNKKNNVGNTVKELIEESLLRVMIEPGYTIFASAGCSVMSVLSVEKNADGTQRVVVDGNMYDLSIQMREQFFDPLLISPKHNTNDVWEGYVVGNLCREEDILIKRAVHFSKTPERGDVIIFYNTGAYSSSFETANAHMHAPSKEIAMYKLENNTFIHK